MPTPVRTAIADGLALAVVVAVMLAGPLLSPPVTHHGEAREGLVVQDIVTRGDWILPRRNGELPSKPPLFHWSAALVTKLLGASDGALRLPSAVAALVVVLAVYALGHALGGRVAAWLGSAILLGMVPFLDAAAVARVDMTFTAAITVALAAFRLWDAGRRPIARAFCHGGIAAAVLAKGPAGALVPIAVIVAFLASERRLGVLRTFWSWPLALATVAVDGGWYALAAADGGSAFLQLQIVHENLERVIGGAAFHHSERHTLVRMPWSLFVGLLPWSLILPWSGVTWLRGRRPDDAAWFLHAWWMTVLVIFTLSAGQRSVYLLPAAPAVALLAARWLAVRISAGAPPLLGRLRPPHWIRHHTRGPWPAMIALVLVVDVTTMLALQVTREHRAARASIVVFADAVRNVVPANAPLFAGGGLGRDATLVLAYRTARPLPREPAVAPTGAYCLVPASEVAGRAAAGHALLAISARQRGPNVALMRGPTLQVSAEPCSELQGR